MTALTVLNTRSQIPSRRPEHYLRGQRTASTAATERGPSAGAHPLEEGAIGFAVFDHSVYGAHPLGRDRGVGLAAAAHLPGMPISSSCRCFEMSMATSKVEAVEWLAVIASLLSGVVVQNHC